MTGQRIVRLLKNHIYPTYQLYAVMENRKTAPQDGLRLGALVVIEWLRQRLGENVPAELAAIPAAARYREIGHQALPSLHINQGFVIDIVSMPEEGVWTLQITEPDLGSDPGNPDQAREAVAGRIIETNVGFRAKETRLECGFQTVISDPDSTSERADVYRLALVHRLIQHPDFGLRQALPFRYKPSVIETAGQLDALLDLWRNRENQIPCVIFTPAEAPRPAIIQPNWKVSAVDMAKPSLSAMPPLPIQEAVCPYDVDKFAKYGITFCHTFLLKNALLERFSAKSRLRPKPGDIIVLEPKSFGGKGRLLPFQSGDVQQENTLTNLRQEMYTYPREKEISFGGITFLSAARENLLYNTEATLQQSRLLSKEWQQHLEQLKLQWEAELRRKDDEKQAVLEQLERQKLYAVRVEQEKDRMQTRHEAALAGMRISLEEREEEIAYLRRKLSQPREHGDIAPWIETHFSRRLLLHPKAIKCLEAREARTVDIGLICDALDFLATDYWEQRYRRISSEEMRNRCSKKYGRPFDVAPVGSTTIEFYPVQYKIKYFVGVAGKPVESPLNCHLRVGNDVESLLRIYFLHDDEKQLIVVGSLPRHLRTVTIS